MLTVIRRSDYPSDLFRPGEEDELLFKAFLRFLRASPRFYHRNALGSVMEITDMSESVAVSYRYDPYGAVAITRKGRPFPRRSGLQGLTPAST